MSIKELLVGRFNIEYYDSGISDLPVMVFAHGLGGNLRQWSAQFKAFEDQYRVIAFSLQGHGSSSKPLEEGAYTIPAYTDTAIILLKALDVSVCTWVGNSMGGVIGYSVMEKEPALITHLITNGTTPEIQMSTGLLRVLHGMDRLLIRLMKFDGYIRFAAKNSSKYTEAVEGIYDLFEQTTPMTITTSHQILGDYTYLKLIESIDIPISIIQSPEDKDINKYLKKQKNRLGSCEHVRFYDLPDSGHICNMEKSEEYNDLLARILIK